eukprot:CAMPEP_0119564664 /NCGR_PEP_ID=MMETSP1352-20130426/27643_1 /TAXON_ID=265584 /ORGANISM="Stauroneis constricta, Strain CCMP1120" /LENGTH=56 /DNA_ID=CAMNT_0007613437 /DNA_START=14 /DNA_END=180 /DNA_ORIENTATION=-
MKFTAAVLSLVVVPAVSFSYLDNLSSGSNAPSGSGIGGYLDNLPAAQPATSGGGFT